MLQAAWISGTLIVIDTAPVTGTMYVSVNARPELYLSYFILMLIAASLRRLSMSSVSRSCSVRATESSCTKALSKQGRFRSDICWACPSFW
ncbi:MAG: hypothetical protein ACM34B_08700 [Nitrospira sp.]